MKKKLLCTMNHLVIIVACLLAIFPYFLIALSVFSTPVDIRRGNIFANVTLQNWVNNFNELINSLEFFIALRNSVFISILTVLIGVLLSSLAGYAYAIYQNKYMDKLFKLSFFSVMIPASANIIPLFMILGWLNMLDSLFTIVIVSLSLPFLIYLFRQNTKLFPLELIKLGRIDGLGEIAIFFKIYVPNMIAVFVTASLILFVTTWNSLLYPLVIIQSQRNMTLPLYINRIGTGITANLGLLMITLFISTFPILVIFTIAQKYFRTGMRAM